jgi:anti-sigma-K factor RskA
VLPAFAEVVPPVEPPAGLKARIMAAAAADLEARGGAIASPVVPSAPTPPVAFPGPEQQAARQARMWTGGWLLRIAAALVIVVLGGWNVLLQGQLSDTQSYQRNVTAVLDAMARPGSLSAVLTADGGTGSGLAAIKADGGVAMVMRDLAPTSGNAVYEAWVIAGDGVPVPLGDFKVGSSGNAYFESVGLPTADGIVLALTLEAGPGATAPTMPIISKGVAAARG